MGCCVMLLVMQYMRAAMQALSSKNFVALIISLYSCDFLNHSCLITAAFNLPLLL
jgi:hypothetical protein